MAAPTQRDFRGYGDASLRVRWPGGARIALSIVVNFEEGAEASPARGDSYGEPMGDGFVVPHGERDLRNESHFGYGPRVGFDRLLAIFEKHDVRTTFYICGKALEARPDLGAEITRRGHEPAGHGYRWGPAAALSREEEQLHIARTVALIERHTGERPVGWYARGPSVNTRELLGEEGGFLYDSNSFADDLPYFTTVAGKKWLVVPYSIDVNDAKYAMAPGYCEPEDFYLQMKSAFDCLYAEGEATPKMMSVGLHLRWSGQPARAGAVDRFLEYAKAHHGVWICARRDIARWWLDHGETFLPAADAP